jgi:hypothetical protein
MLYFHTQSGWMLLDEMDISRIRNAKVVSSILALGKSLALARSPSVNSKNSLGSAPVH